MKAVRSAEYNLGNLLRRRGDLQEAEHWYDRAANAGHHGAETNLGHILQLRGNPEEAERWWRRAASAGNHDAQYNLGVLLKNLRSWDTSKRPNAGINVPPTPATRTRRVCWSS
jgi:TPR repeat protein